ncbi:large conductance mechanosensitive channel protein MscL [Radiobacillus kanasensis]|uniref:large conductance mechanosensitive channel protein MscL n=1 Tax=Radiobacillus kanasensis TaxID=2844358 RepID=UPI001E2DBFA1|nr:large conductance mechanosensitive channel protein MscL [Radiobacillus kanasensis]UFT99687.1 large conductance mechanosensitive channel protein MscL [Radiobacillus kanasensis]
MGILKEFRHFVVRGNAADMGIGMVLGAAFSSVIDSIVTDVLLPPIGLVLAKMNFSNLFISLNGEHYPSLSAAQEAGAATINYGLFITAIIRFTIILFTVFLVVRQINRLRKPDQTPMDSMMKKECPYCITSIPAKAVKCSSCGSTLDDSSMGRFIKQKRKEKVKLRIR